MPISKYAEHLIVAFFTFCFMPLLSAAASDNSTSTVKKEITAPVMPTIQSLTMPTIVTPTIDSSFYTPLVPNVPSVKTAGTTGGTTAAPTTTGNAALQAKSSSLPQKKDSISAADIENLGNLGILQNLAGLIGGNTTSPQTLQTLSSTASSDNSFLLNKILSELQTLKQTQAENIKALPNAHELKTTTGKPSILRFTVNGTDLLPTCHTIYFSGCEQNGSFLLTGDRKYSMSDKIRTETFYLLFSATGSDGSRTFYSVTPAISQDSVNKQSSLYHLSQKQKLSASKTGHLVTMHINDSSWNMDLLLDIGISDNKQS